MAPAPIVSPRESHGMEELLGALQLASSAGHILIHPQTFLQILLLRSPLLCHDIPSSSLFPLFGGESERFSV